MHLWIHRLNFWFSHLPARLAPLRWWISLLFVIGMTFLFFGLPKFEFSWGKESPFREDDPVRLSLDHLKSVFSGTETLVIVFRPRDQNLFSTQTLQTLHHLRDTLENLDMEEQEQDFSALEHILDIQTLVNAAYSEVEEDQLQFRDFVIFPLDENTSVSSLRAQALSHRDYPRKYFSNNEIYGAFLIRTDFGAIPVASEEEEDFTFENAQPTSSNSDPIEFETHHLQEYVDFEKALFAILARPEFSTALEFEISPWGASYRQQVLETELNYGLIASIVFGVGFASFLFQSLTALVWPFLIILSCMLGMVGFTGWVGWSIDLELYIVIALIAVVTLADVVHVLSGYLYFRNQGMNHDQIMKAVFQKTAFACLLTSVTTAIGVFSLYWIKLETIQSMGLLAGMGVLLAFFVTIFVFPVFLSFWSPLLSSQTIGKQEHSHWIQSFLRKIQDVPLQYSGSIILFFSLLSLFLLLGLTQIQVDTNAVREYEKGSPIREVLEILDEHLLGTNHLEIMIDSGENDALKDPRFFKAMEDIENFLLATYPESVVDTYSLLNLVKDTYQKLNGNQIEYYRVPDERETLAQILLLLETENYEDFEQVLTVNYQITRLSIFLQDPGSAKAVEMMKTIQAEVEHTFAPLLTHYPHLQATVTGGLAIWAQLNEYISWSQIQSFGMAFCIISILLMFLFGSLKTGLIAILPNTFPALMVFGIMGWFEIRLDLTTLLVAPVIIGIAVDDTIHFLTHYRLYLIKGLEVGEALRHTFREVGQALLFTTIILVIAFMCFIPVAHVGISQFSILACIAIVSALLADLLWLPALLYRGQVK